MYDIEEGCYHEDDMKHLFRNSSGTAVAIDMSGSDDDHGIYASAYHEVVSSFSQLIKINAMV